MTPLERAITEDPLLCPVLLRLAQRQVGKTAEAQDMMQEALTRAIVKSRRTGEPKDGVSFIQFVGSFLNGLGVNHRRREKRRAPTEYDDGDPQHAEGRVPDPERAILHRDEALRREQRTAELRRLLDGEPIPLALLDWADQGVDDHEELAARIGCPLEEIKKARRRLGYVGRKITSSEEGRAS